MFCAQCGKKLNQDMLFCPYCGSPIVPLEEEDSTREEDLQQSRLKTLYGRPEEVASAEADTVEQAQNKEEPETVEEFIPLDQMYAVANEPEEKPKTVSIFENVEEDDTALKVEKAKPVHLTGHVPELNRKAVVQKAEEKGKRPSTYVPPKKEPAPGDLFLDGDDVFDDDDDEDFAFEERDEGSFVSRHIRGVVSLILLGMLLSIILMWAFSSGGQRAMAQLGISNNAKAYAELGMEAYQQNAYSAAGLWYEKALQRDEDNYEYAKSAGICYYYAQNSDRAEKYFRLAIEIEPTEADPYVFIRALYSNAQGIPNDVLQLLRAGYQQTGDLRLKLE